MRNPWEFTGRRVSPGRHYFDCEGTIVACYDPNADGDQSDATPLSEPSYLAVDELEVTFENAKAAGASLSHEEVPGERSFYTEDPFGNSICFVSRDSAFRG